MKPIILGDYQTKRCVLCGDSYKVRPSDECIREILCEKCETQAAIYKFDDTKIDAPEH